MGIIICYILHFYYCYQVGIFLLEIRLLDELVHCVVCIFSILSDTFSYSFMTVPQPEHNIANSR